MYTQENKAMTIGDWIVTLIVLAIPMVGLIMQFVWAFSSDTHPSKKTFCQAGLLLAAIFIGLGVMLVVAFGGFAAIMSAAQQQSGGI